jgi:dTDP-4-amino-4,6-dideoxygalactose transaminase
MNEINAIAKRHNLEVIEDSAQCMGSRYYGKHGGTFGKVGAISAHPLKNLNAVGDGGFVLTDDDAVADKIRLKRNHGLANRDDVVLYGLNSRLDVLNAEILKFRLTRLDEIIARRKHNADLYRHLITTDAVFIPEDKEFEQNSYVMFITQAERRDELKEHLTAKGVETLVYYGTPLHFHKAAKDQGYKPGDFPVAETQCEKVLALPHNQCIGDDQVAYAAEAVNAFYG